MVPLQRSGGFMLLTGQKDLHMQTRDIDSVTEEKLCLHQLLYYVKLSLLINNCLFLLLLMFPTNLQYILAKQNFK